ncbi:MAG: hypothetical protein J6O55_04395 [Lachnospiraceae bacterium]|nr:hypothetical protein [Lachnospiraceae bacterium]
MAKTPDNNKNNRKPSKIAIIFLCGLLSCLSLTGCMREALKESASDEMSQGFEELGDKIKGFWGSLQDLMEETASTIAETVSGTAEEDDAGRSPFYGEESIVVEEEEDAGGKEEGGPEEGAEEIKEGDKEEKGEDEEEAEGVPDSDESVMEDERNYCFSTLDKDDKKLYMQLYNCFFQMKEDVRLSSLDTGRIDRIFNLVMMDHPSLFFVDGYRTTLTTRDGVPIKLEISGKYNCSKEERKRKEAEIESAAADVLVGVPEGEGEYEQVKYIFEWIISHTEYDLNAPDNQNISSVFLNGRSVCQGYTMATKYLLDRLGIFCTLAYGTTDDESHSWNLVRIDGTYCYLDTTWGDSSYRSGGNLLTEQTNYNYFGCDENILERTHKLESPVELPKCNSLDAYYYVRESLYFKSADMARLQAVFNYERTLGEHIFTVRFADDDIYNEMSEALFTEEKIFDLLPGMDRVRYIKDDRECTLSFSV